MECTRRNWLGMAAAALAGSQAKAGEPRIVVPPYNTLTDAEEVALGGKFAAQLQSKMPVLAFTPLTSYIDTMVGDLGRQSQRRNIRYVARVINTADVNAVSLPGGYIFVFRGLLDKVRDESELAGVLAHEVGHIAARHSANQMMINFHARNLIEVVKKNVQLQNTVIQQIIEKFGGPLAMLALLRYGREQEFEADLLGLYSMLRCGWNGNGMASFFLRGAPVAGGGDWLESALSTHPHPADRAKRIQSELAGIRQSPDAKTTSMSFKAMKLALAMLPAPVKQSQHPK